MALESTSILLQQQKALGDANKFVDYGKTIDKTLGKAIEKEVEIRKKAEDVFTESMTEYNIEALQTDEYPEDWGPDMTAELSRQKQEYAAAAQIVKTTRDKTSKEYIDAVAKMSQLKAGMSGMRTKIDLWRSDAAEFAKLAEEGAITEGLSVNERNKLFGYNNSKNTKPVFKDGRFGVEYNWIDKDGREQTEIAYEGEQPRVVAPATKEIEAVNAKYNDAVKLIGEGKWNESAWTQDVRNFTNTLNFDQLRSFAGDFESVNGSQRFDDIEFVKTRQEQYKKDNPFSEFGKWWQDPANKGELKEGITQFFKDTYLPKFREFQQDQKSKQRINSAYKAFSVTGDEKSFNIVKTMQINDDVRRALSSTNIANGKAGEIYAGQIASVFDGAGLVTDEGAPLEIGFISSNFGSPGVDYSNASRETLLKGIEESGSVDGQLGSRPLGPGDSIVIYPSEIRTGEDEDMTADQRAKYKPKVITIPKGLKNAGRREVQNFLRQAYRDSFENMVIDDAYFDGSSEKPDNNPL